MEKASRQAGAGYPRSVQSDADRSATESPIRLIDITEEMVQAAAARLLDRCEVSQGFAEHMAEEMLIAALRVRNEHSRN